MTNTTIPPRGSDRLPTIQHAAVADVMHPGVVHCSPDTDLTTVARTMTDHHIHSVVVGGVEEATRGSHLVWGLVTALDLVAARSAVTSATAGDIAAGEVVTIEPQEPLETAARLMTEHDISHLIVVSPTDRRPVGVVSALDLAGAMAWGEA